MLTRGVAQQLAAGRDRAPVAPPEPLDLCHLSGARDDRHDVRRPQERVRRRLDRPRVAAETGFAERLDHVAATERRARARETLRAGQILEGELAVRTERRAAERPSRDAPQLLPAEPQLGRPSPPLPNKVLGTLRDVLLPARGQRRRLGRARSLGAAPFERRLDLGAPPAERLANRTRDADDLADPTPDRAPLDAHRSRELRPQHGLVDEARRPRVRVQPPPVERRPAPVAAPRHVRHEQVRVQLRIAGTRRPVPEPRSHEPGHRLDHRTCRPSPDRRGRPLEVAEGLPDGPVMRRADARSELVVPDAEEHADALGRRERQVEPAHANPAAAVPERRAVPRIAPGEHAPQILSLHRPVEPELAPRRTEPLAARLRRAEVVVLDPFGHAVDDVDADLRLVEVVLGLAGRELADREHPEQVSGAQAAERPVRRNRISIGVSKRTSGSAGPLRASGTKCRGVCVLSVCRWHFSVRWSYTAQAISRLQVQVGSTTIASWSRRAEALHCGAEMLGW